MSKISKADRQIEKCINQVEVLAQIFSNPSDIMLEIANTGKDLALEQLPIYGIDANGELGKSVNAHLIDNKTSELVADGGHAIYVEYGAGIIGKQHPHKLAKQHGVEYNKGSQIKHFDDANKDFWTYLNEKDGHFYKTHGQQSKPFMYKAVIKLNRKVPSIIRNKIKELTK